MELRFTFRTLILPREISFKNKCTGEVVSGDIILLALFGNLIYVLCAHNMLVLHENSLLIVGAKDKTIPTKLPLIGTDWNLISQVTKELNESKEKDPIGTDFKLMPIDRILPQDRIVIKETFKFLAA